MNMPFRGTAPALVTPFTGGEIDHDAYHGLIDRQIAAGADALVVLGTTGENATIWPDERRSLVDRAIGHVAGRVPVIVGTGNNSTSESIAFSKEAAASGADGLLVVGPYYNKPTQKGFAAHVAAIADATDCPITLYNVPSRTSFNATAETILGIARDVPTVVGVKEASGCLAQVSDILAHRDEDFAVYAGDDEMALPLLALGADGVISVVSNVLPKQFGALVCAGLAGEFRRAARMHFDLLPAMRACFQETNPVPTKTILAHLGLIEFGLRLPLVEMEDENRRRVIAAFAPYIAAET